MNNIIYHHQVKDPSIIFNYKKFMNYQNSNQIKVIETQTYLRNLMKNDSAFYDLINYSVWNNHHTNELQDSHIKLKRNKTVK